MKDKLIEWLNSNQDKQLDFDDNVNRLTINPKDDFVRIKYWEPKQVKGTDLFFWWSISKIKITPEFLSSCTNSDDLADFLYNKLKEGGDHEMSIKS